MIKNTLIIALSSFVFISCSTSSKTASTTQSSKNEATVHPKTTTLNISATKKVDTSKNLKAISVSDSKRAVTQSKQQVIQKVK